MWAMRSLRGRQGGARVAGNVGHWSSMIMSATI